MKGFLFFIRLIEIWTEFSLTSAQVEEENKLAESHPEAEPHNGQEHPEAHGAPSGQHEHHRSSTAVTLARRAANILSLAQDTVIFQGLNAFPVGGVGGSPLFSSQTVLNRGVPSDTGLLCIGGPNPLPSTQVLPVQLLPIPGGGAGPVPAQYSENTVAVVNTAYSILSANGYPGPYVCVLHFYPYADTFVPLANTLILPADRIKPLMEEGYYASSGLPGTATPQNPQQAATMPNPPILPPTLSPPPTTQPKAVGLVMSLGGNVVDHVNGLDPITAFSQVDATGNHTFRVLSRFAVRLKDQMSVVRLEFQ